MITIRVLLVLASIQLCACVPRARIAPSTREQTRAAADSTESVRRFVQAFYDRYVQVALSNTIHVPAWYHILTNADLYLDADLAAALRADSIARQDEDMKQTREILDFDPFLASQDPCAPYEVIDVRPKGEVFLVPLRVCHAKSAGPVVEIRAFGGRWKIANILDLDGGRDLKSYLCEWAKKDLRSERRPAKC